MPIGVAGAVALGGAAIGAVGSIVGGSQQASAVNSSSKAAIRQQEEARIIDQQNLTNTLSAVGPRLESAGDRANMALNDANANAAGNLNTYYGAAGQALSNGYNAAGQQIQQAGDAATNYLGSAWSAIGSGVQNANALLQPYIDTGSRAVQMTGDLSGANGVAAGQAALANFEASPAYQFNLDQGLRAVDAGAAARGMLVSGGTRQAEQKFGAGLASNEFANYYNRLSGLATQGLNASNTYGSNVMQGAAGQSGIDRALAQTALTQGGALAANDVGLGGGLANISSDLGKKLASNSMLTGNALAANEQQTGAQISNLYTGNASQQGQLNAQAAQGIAQTQASTGSALAGIYGNQAQGVTNAITSGLNNYTYLNQLSPQAQGGTFNMTQTQQGAQPQQYY